MPSALWYLLHDTWQHSRFRRTAVFIRTDGKAQFMLLFYQNGDAVLSYQLNDNHQTRGSYLFNYQNLPDNRRLILCGDQQLYSTHKDGTLLFDTSALPENNPLQTLAGHTFHIRQA